MPRKEAKLGTIFPANLVSGEASEPQAINFPVNEDGSVDIPELSVAQLRRLVLQAKQKKDNQRYKKLRQQLEIREMERKLD